MTLTLRIENETSLPDGGPLSVTIQGKRGIDIGRDSHLDWTLPDPTRFISGKHCEVRYKNGGYWLHDVSTNGTFLNGADHRMQAPHRLGNGDRFVVGNYVIAVALEGDEASVDSAPQSAMAFPAARPVNYQEIWANEGEIAPAIDPKQLKSAEIRSPGRSDFLEWAADVPHPVQERSRPAGRPDAAAPRPAPGQAVGPDVDPYMDWAAGAPSHAPPLPPAPPPVPTPRRPALRGGENPWDDAPPIREASSPFVAERTPAPAPSASPASAPPAGARGPSDAFLRQLAAAAGLPDNHFEQMEPAELAQQLGSVLRIKAENLMQLLSARAQAKQMARSSTHTMVQALDNNPLKFAPSAPEALRIMFGPATQSYLDARRAVEQSFEDLKKHQIKTYAAMQHALSMLMADLGPQAIEQNTEEDRGIAGLVASRKAKLWESYVARWQAKVRQDDGAPIEAFMLHFAEYYDRDGG